MEKKTILIPGDTSGTINNDNGQGLWLQWVLMAGTDRHKAADSWSGTTSDIATSNQVNALDSTSNNIYLTGVQLEVGDTATDFEHRTFSDELTRCQRYYNRSYPYGFVTGAADTNNNTPIHHMSRGGSYNMIGQFFHPRDMRAAPTVVIYNPIDGTVNQLKGDGSSFANAAVLKNTAKGAAFFVNGTTITATIFLSVHATFDAEL